MPLRQGLQTTARRPSKVREAVSSGPQRHFISNEKLVD